MTKKIAVIGATGMLGKPVVDALVKSGFEVVALVRNPVAARAVLPPAVQLITGDIRRTDDIRRFLAVHSDYLYLNLNLRQHEKPGDFHAEEQGLANILEAVKGSTVSRIGFISSIVMNYQGMNGFAWWVFALKHRAVQQIRDCGIPYTIFYPSTFMDNFKATYRKGNRILLAGESKYKMHFIAAEDFASQVVRSFERLSAESREYVVQGVNAYTADEAAQIYVTHYTKEKLQITKAPLGLMKFLGNFSQTVSYGAHIVEALNNYPEKFEAASTWADLGKPAISLEEFARR